MSDTGEWLLGVIAAALTLMALVQIGAIVASVRLARRVERLAQELETGVKPLIANLLALSTEATRAASLAAAQVERLDTLFADLTRRADVALATMQRYVARPARDGVALVVGVRAAVTALQAFRESARRRSASRPALLEEEEESLFIG